MRRADLALLIAGAGVLAALLGRTLVDPSLSPATYGDNFAYQYPMRHLVQGALQAGRMPFWNPYIFMGVPLAANPQAGLFYPVSALGAVFPLALAFTWDIAFHWAWAGLGLVLLARREGLGAAEAFLLAALYALSPFLVYRITAGISVLLAALAWVPWCWLAWSSGRRGLLAAVWCLQLLSGHPQFMVVNALGMGIAALLTGRPFAALAFLAREAGWVVMLAAAQWMPAYEFLARSQRVAWGIEQARAYSLDLASLATWVHPGALGTPMAGDYAGFPSVFFEVCGVSIGAGGLLLAALGARRRPLLPLALVGLGLALAFARVGPLAGWIQGLGPLGWMRTPSRWALLCVWGLICAAGAAIRAGRAAPWAARALLAAGVLQLLWWDARFVRTEPNARYLSVNREVVSKAGGRRARVMTDPALASPNKSALYRAMNVNGYESYYLGAFAAFAFRSEGTAVVDSSRSYLSRPDTPLMRLSAVSAYLALDGGVRDVAGAQPLAYWLSAGSPRLEGPELSIPRPELWELRGAPPADVEPDALIAAQPFYPGWRAWHGGRELALGVWQGFFQRIPWTGGGSLRLRFVPTGWPLWVAFSVGSWLLWFDRRLRGRDLIQ